MLRDPYAPPKEKVYSMGNGRIIDGKRANKDFPIVDLRCALAQGIVKYGLNGLSVEQRVLLQAALCKYQQSCENEKQDWPVSSERFDCICRDVGLNPDAIRQYWGFDRSIERGCISRLFEIACHSNKSWVNFLTAKEKKELDEGERLSKRIVVSSDGKRAEVGYTNDPEQMELF